MNNNKTHLIDMKNFETLTERVNRENADGEYVYTVNYLLDNIGKRLHNTYDLSPYADVKPSLEAMQDFIIQELEQSHLSDRFKKHLQVDIKETKSVTDLLLWLVHHTLGQYD